MATTIKDNVLNALKYFWNDKVSPALGLKVNTADIVDNLTTSSKVLPLSALQGKTLNDTKVNTADIVDNVTSTDTNKPLSANQGKVLSEAIETLDNENSIFIENGFTSKYRYYLYHWFGLITVSNGVGTVTVEEPLDGYSYNVYRMMVSPIAWTDGGNTSRFISSYGFSGTTASINVGNATGGAASGSLYAGITLIAVKQIS